MEQKHRTILQHHWSNISDNVEPMNILSKFVTVLRESDKEEIRKQSTKQERCDKLLRILLRRGENAFDAFVNSLDEEAPDLASELIGAVTRLENKLIDAREQGAKLMRRIRGESKTDEDEEEEDHRNISKDPKELRSPHGTFKTENQELSGIIQQHRGHDESCSRCEGLRNERDSARRENQALHRKIQELNNMITKKSEYHQEENQVLQNSLERVNSEQENLQKLYENLEAEKKDQGQIIRQLTSENKELKQEVTKKTSEIGKILACEQKKNKKLKDSRDKFQAEIDAKDVELQKMREENKRLHEESNAEKPKCDDHPREEVGSLWQMPWPGRVYNYEKDFDSNGVVYALIRNSGSPNTTQTSITATRSSDEEGKAIDILENRVDREIVSGTKAEEKSGWCVDLTENYALYLTHYTLRHGHKTSFSYLLNWRLQGSHDGQSWETLRTHENDRRLKGKDPCCTCTCAIGGKSEVVGDRWKKAFRYFRIFQTGKNSSGRFGIFLSGIELYGVLVKIGR